MAMSLEKEFHREMEAIYHVAATLDYRPTYFLRMASNMVALRRQSGF